MDGDYGQAKIYADRNNNDRTLDGQKLLKSKIQFKTKLATQALQVIKKRQSCTILPQLKSSQSLDLESVLLDENL